MRWSLSHLASACAALLLFVAPPTSALHESDVGVVDWHKLLVGVPLVGAPVLSPTFHSLNFDANTDNRTKSTIGKTGSVILTATANNVLAALRPDDGAVVWRQIYEPDDRIAGYYAQSNFVATLSGPGGANFRIFDAISGAIHLEKRLHAPETGHLAEPHHLGTHVAFGGIGNEEIYVLTDGHVVRRLNGKTGEVQWTWAADDQTAMVIHTNLVPTPNAVFLVGLTKSIASFTLHITALDPQTGAVLGTQAVPSSIKHLDAYVLLSDSAQTMDEKKAPHVVWLEDGVLKSFKLTPKLNAKPAVVTFKPKTRSNTPYEHLIDVGLKRQGHVLAVAGDGSATPLALGDGRVEGVGAFSATVKPNVKKAKKEDRKEVQEDEDENTDSIWVGSTGENEGEVMFGRVYWSHAVNKAKTETLTLRPTGGATPNLQSAVLEVDFDTRSHGIITHATLSRPQAGIPQSLLLTTSTGAVQLWELSPAAHESWTREEALAAIALAEFVELPEGRPDPAGSGGRREEEGFVGRVWRHIGDAKNFPQYLNRFVRRFLTGSYASPTSAPVPASPSSSSTSNDVPTRDAFGFRQLIVAATVQGKIYALDSSNGRIVWNRVLGLGWAAEVGANVLPVKMFVLGAEDTAGEDEDLEGRGPSVVLVAQRRADNTLVDTVIFHMDALTGADASRTAANDPGLRLSEDPSGLLQGIDIIQGPAVEAFLLSPPPASPSTTTTSPKDHTKAVLLLDEYLQAYLYPSTPRTRATLRALRPSLHFPLRTNTPSGTRVAGHALGPHAGGHKADEGDQGERGYVAYSTWTLGLPPNEDVKAIIPPIRGPVASLGKVLGNRTTLYKYLNPRLFVLLTAPRAILAVPGEGQGQTCGLYVVDAAKGSVAYRTRLPTVVGKEAGKEACDVKAMLVENWLVYHYYDPEWTGPGLTKGWRMVSVELYEGSGPDDKTRSSDMSSYSDGSVNVTAFEQAYVFPHAITALSPTTTKFGMTSKDLIVASRTHQIQSIQRRLLDPRRPNRKVTAEEQEEFLVPYEPVLANDPKRVLSHHYEVANIQRIVTSPALLESTSLVFAYGLDMFLTRVAPSGTFDVLNENFNKVQLVLTVSGLALAIMFTKPMVRRKQLREKWYQ